MYDKEIFQGHLDVCFLLCGTLKRLLTMALHCVLPIFFLDE